MNTTNKSITSKHDPTFDIVKGIAIISVVLGHSRCYSFLDTFVNSYHIATFFFVAGYFIKERHLSNSRQFVWKKIRTLYFPFILASLLCIVFSDVLIGLNIEAPTDKTAFDKISMLFTDCMWSANILGTTWFLPALFEAVLVSYFIFKIRNIRIEALVTVAIVVSAKVMMYYKLPDPWNIWECCLLVPICYWGHLCAQKKKLLDVTMKHHIGRCLVCFVIIVLLLVFHLKGNLQLGVVNYLNPLGLYTCAFLGPLMIYDLSCIIQKYKISNFIELCGQHSYAIMILQFLAFKIVNYLQCLVYGYDFTKIAEHPYIPYHNVLWFIPYFIVGLFVPLALDIVYTNLKNKIISRKS